MSSSGCLSIPARWTCDVPDGHGHTFSAQETRPPPRRNPAFAEELGRWLDRVLGWYGDRILPVTLPVARRWGRLSATLGHGGADLLIAATALEHGLMVVTRNARHFEPTGVQVLNPFGRGGTPQA